MRRQARSAVLGVVVLVGIHAAGCTDLEQTFPAEVPSVCDAAAACPEGMVRFWAFGEGTGLDGLYHIEGGECFCIDRYEASQGPDGAAVSVPGAEPWTDVFFDEAQAACVAAGKKLCQRSEWRAACQGFPAAANPYGDTPDFTRCNVGPTVAPTGSFSGCEGGVPGLFDMQGNVAEWTRFDGREGCHPIFECQAHGGSAAVSSGGALQCSSRNQLDPNSERSGVLGFRCCSVPGAL